MARQEQPSIAVATKTFMDGETRARIKAGTRFAIDKPNGELEVIRLARFRQLSASGLMRALNDADLKAAPKVRYAEQAAAIARNKPAPEVAAKPVRPTSPRIAARRRTQPAEPPAPQPFNGASVTVNQAGSQIGTVTPQSSSQAVQASKPLTSRKRGTRAG